ncbi:DNA methyltransferase [Mesorhizobium sp.]|uniref:DNA methyltransferase n=1 Tax=Mesorhizobium sp. TaxID=1871066 RepID=UPI00257E778E|nr:DNA methyltransferase [Mesorhizobium sp.]
MRRPIENNSSPGQAVYEPFCGSGTTIIAAEMTGRCCHANPVSGTGPASRSSSPSGPDYGWTEGFSPQPCLGGSFRICRIRMLLPSRPISRAFRR